MIVLSDGCAFPTPELSVQLKLTTPAEVDTEDAVSAFGIFPLATNA